MDSLATAAILRRLYASSFCMDGGFFLIMAALPFKVLALGGGPVALGLVPAILSVAIMIFTLLAGRWSDRAGRTWLCPLGNLILIAFALLSYRIMDLRLLMLSLPLMGIGKAIYWPAIEAMVGDLATGGHLARSVNLFNVSWSAGKAVGFFAGGTLLALFDFRTTFLCGAALVVGALLTLPRPRGVRAPAGGARAHTLDEEPGSAEPADAERPADPPEDVRRTFRTMGWLANFTAVGALAVLNVHLPKWFTDRGWDESRFGLLLAVILLVQTGLFYLLAVKFRFSYSFRWLFWPQIASALCLLVVPWTAGYGWLLVCAPVLGVSFGITYAASITYSLHAAAGRGKYAGIHESLIGAGGFLPPLLGGLLVGWSGWLGAPYLLSSGFIAAALIPQLWLRHRMSASFSQPAPGPD